LDLEKIRLSTSITKKNSLGVVRFYPNPYGLRRIEEILIPGKLKFISIRINPFNPYGLKITEQALRGRRSLCLRSVLWEQSLDRANHTASYASVMLLPLGQGHVESFKAYA
jgi:hypothetical protein